MPSFQVRNPVQQCASSLARFCDALDRCLTYIVWALGGAAIGMVLIGVIAFARLHWGQP